MALWRRGLVLVLLVLGGEASDVASAVGTATQGTDIVNALNAATELLTAVQGLKQLDPERQAALVHEGVQAWTSRSLGSKGATDALLSLLSTEGFKTTDVYWYIVFGLTLTLAVVIMTYAGLRIRDRFVTHAPRKTAASQKSSLPVCLKESEVCAAGTWKKKVEEHECVWGADVEKGSKPWLCVDCKKCPAGQKYKGRCDAHGAPECENCEANHYTPKPSHATKCEPCPKLQCFDNHPAQGTCGPGGNNLVCPCPRGYVGAGITAEDPNGCKPCPRGEYQAEENQLFCTKCPHGQFSTKQIGEGGSDTEQLGGTGCKELCKFDAWALELGVAPDPLSVTFFILEPSLLANYELTVGPNDMVDSLVVYETWWYDPSHHTPSPKRTYRPSPQGKSFEFALRRRGNHRVRVTGTSLGEVASWRLKREGGEGVALQKEAMVGMCNAALEELARA